MKFEGLIRKVTKALQALKSALNGYSESIPIQVLETRFVVEKAPGFRNYTEHSTIYRVNEQVNMYFEPVGIRWKNIGKGLVGVNLNTDVRIETADGSFKLERKNVGLINATAKSPSNDFFMNFFIDSRGYPAGTYVVEITLHDIFKMQQTSFTRQFTLK